MEASIKNRFAGYSLAKLIKRINSAPDFGYDDEEYELSRRAKEQNFTYRWTEKIANPKIIITKDGKEYMIEGLKLVKRGG